MSTSLRTLRAMAELVGMLHRAAPRLFHLAALCHLCLSALPVLTVLATAKLLEDCQAGGTRRAGLLLGLALAGLAALEEALGAATGLLLDTLRDRVRFGSRARLINRLASVQALALHEDPGWRETLALSQQALDRLSEATYVGFYVLTNALAALPLLLATAVAAWWVPLLLLAGLLPPLILRSSAEHRSWNVEVEHAATFQRLGILERILTLPEFFKDLRVFRMAPRLSAEWMDRYRAYLDSSVRTRGRNAACMAAGAGITFLALGTAVASLLGQGGARRGAFTDLAIFLTAVLQLRTALTAIVFNAGDLIKGALALEPLKRLEAFEARQDAPSGNGLDAGGLTALELRDVDFAYPQGVRAALHAVRTVLEDARSLAVVGENGAGKSTLVKLVCGLHVPLRGGIAWKRRGESLRVVTVFQDFARFPLSVLDNLACQDPARAREVLAGVGLGSLADRLEAPLTPELPGGIALSGGEWQRLALARAWIHKEEADLLVLDEPSAALDPGAEAWLLGAYRDLVRGKPSILVSQRMALARLADRILVLERGRVVEEGSHDELMRKGGRYFRMFDGQAGLYRGNGCGPG